VSRQSLFEKEPVPGLSGLVGLTAPGKDEGVGMVIDAIVLGAKGDGKTQLIAHAIRTLDAHGPAGLSPDEQLQNEKMLALVLNAKRPQPEANPDRKVRHYVTRVRPENLLDGLSAWGRAAFVVRAGLATRYLAFAVLALPVVLALLRAIRGDFDLGVVAGVVVAAGAGAAWALHTARRDFVRLGGLEVVFWDVAGEDVYSDRGAAAYHAFLGALAARRQARTDGVRWALAPMLVCNPLALGRRGDDSPYARLRLILPSFAALGGAPEVLVVVNRWDLADKVVAPRAEAAECLAVLPVAREAAPVNGEGPREPLPVVRRDVVLRHCLDGEPVALGSTRFRLIRYEAGLDTDVREAPWGGYAALSDEARARFGEPTEPPTTEIGGLVEYRYAEGPGVLAGDAAAGFYRFLARAVTVDRHRQPPPAPEPKVELPPEGSTVKMYGSLVAEEADAKRGGFRSGS